MVTRDDIQLKGLAAELGKRDPFESLEQEVYLNLVRTHGQLAAEFDRLFAEYALTDPQYNALRILRGNGKPMPVYRIAEQMVTRQPDITRLVDRLEASGLVARKRCEQDRRVIFVELTNKAKSLLKRMDEPVRELHFRQLRSLGEDRLRQLANLLREARVANQTTGV